MAVNKYEQKMNNMLWDITTKLFGYSNTIKENLEELSDFFIPLDKDILIIEDKAKENNFYINEKVNIENISDLNYVEEYDSLIRQWITYYNKKIVKAIYQLNGAENYLKLNNTVYKNKSKKNIIRYFYNNSVKIHKILLLHNIDDVCKQYYISKYGRIVYNKYIIKDKLGRYILDEKMKKNNKDFAFLFSFGSFSENVHIFTEDQFRFLLSYLPTLRDIINYLNWKESFLKNQDIVSSDEHSLICLYILMQNNCSPIRLYGKENIVFSDDDILKYETENEVFKLHKNYSNFIADLIYYLESNVSNTDENLLKNKIMKYYLNFDIYDRLSITDFLSNILKESYESASIFYFSAYQEKCLYLFVNIDKRIKEDKNNVLKNNFILGYALTYIEKYKNDIDIEDIVICFIHKERDGNLLYYFASLCIDDLLINIDEINKIKQSVYFNEILLSIDIDKNFKDLIAYFNKVVY